MISGGGVARSWALEARAAPGAVAPKEPRPRSAEHSAVQLSPSSPLLPPFLSLPLPSSPLLSPPLPSSPFLSPPLSSPLYATLSSYMFLSPLPFSSLQDWNNPSSLHGSPLKAWFLHGQLRKRPVDHFWKRGFFETLWSVGPREKAGRLGACNAKQHI